MTPLEDRSFHENDINPLDYFDEDAIYNDGNIDDSKPSHSGVTVVDLYKRKNEDGAVKSYCIEGDGSGSIVYAKEKSNYSLTVERLVWVDGYNIATEKRAMTLVVLKLAFQTSRSGIDRKISFAEAELRFQSDEKNSPGPEVVAWGPFRRPQTWNASIAEVKTSSTADLTIEAGWAGQGVSGGVGRGTERSLNQIGYDKGTSIALFSRSQKKNGVRWTLQENVIHQEGITPEIRVAVLVSRNSLSQPYRATFRLGVHTSTAHAWADKGRTFLGIPREREVRWRVPEPGSSDGYYGEGFDIAGSIDPDNLMRLVDPNDRSILNARWLNPWDRFEIPKPEAILEHQSNAEEAVCEATNENLVDHPPELPRPDVVPPITATHPGAGLAVPSSSLSDEGYNRLVSLEARAASTEARLAAQEALIVKLQRDLTGMQQALSVSWASRGLGSASAIHVGLLAVVVWAKSWITRWPRAEVTAKTTKTLSDEVAGQQALQNECSDGDPRIGTTYVE
ncbi:hypothetical protein F5B22DRAFT_587312 [Xylaria bambusicola]|uniref:uncharacterized protein n=1 Tax=Xylaria bambusicola TaxID=326684 RepID=UPI0020075509|nr:uncharacterized protein F5B22DRAFT_587312 [Xylaria bambusicola]KAI0526728.1 hypothetical protein F5B22DRAFT_587312 [Xylaria bambusicola]